MSKIMTPARTGGALSIALAFAAPAIHAATLPVGPNGAPVSLPGASYTLRMSEDFAAFSDTKWRLRAHTQQQVRDMKCSAVANIEDGQAVVFANGQLIVTGTTEKLTPTDRVTANGFHTEHRGGGIISLAPLGYGFYEVDVKPHLTDTGMHTAFWTRSEDLEVEPGVTRSPPGQGVLEIDALEIDSGNTARVRSGSDLNPPKLFPGTKNLLMLTTDEQLFFNPSTRYLPDQGRGNVEIKIDSNGWLKSGFDYGPGGIRFFENGVVVSHTDFPDSLKQLAARHPVWLTAQAKGLYTGLAGTTPLKSAAAGGSASAFRAFKFYAADYPDVNILANGDFEYNDVPFERSIASTPAGTRFKRDESLQYIYNAATNQCETEPKPAGPTTAWFGSAYPTQWVVKRYDPLEEGEFYTQAQVFGEPTASSSKNQVLRIGDWKGNNLQVKVVQEQRHVNAGQYFFRGRVKRPTGFAAAQVQIRYSGPGGIPALTNVTLPAYSTSSAPAYQDIGPVYFNVSDAGDNTFFEIAVLAKVIDPAIAAEKPTATSPGVSAKNSAGQELVMYLDDLQVYKRSSSSAPAPARSSELPGYDYTSKLAYKNHDPAANGPLYFGDTVGTLANVDTVRMSYHLISRPAGAAINAVDGVTVSTDIFSAKLQTAAVLIKMDNNPANTKKGWALGLKQDGTPYCAIGNRIAHQLLELPNDKILPYASAAAVSGKKLTCTYQPLADGTGTTVKAYLDGIQKASQVYAGYWLGVAPTGSSQIAQYGHNAKIFFSVTANNVQPENLSLYSTVQKDFQGYLANVMVWNTALNSAAVGALGSATTFSASP